MGYSQVVGYICLKLRKNNKAGKSYQKPSRHRCLGIQRWLLVQGAPSLSGEPEGQCEGMYSMVVSPGAIKTQERNQEYVLSPTIAMKKPPLGGEENLKGRSWTLNTTNM